MRFVKRHLLTAYAILVALFVYARVVGTEKHTG